MANRDNIQGAEVVPDILADGAEWDIFNDCVVYADQYATEQGQDSVVKLTQTQFTACLRYINHVYIKPSYDLHTDYHKGMYDIDRLYVMYLVYRSLTERYDKAITLSGYCALCGISDVTIKGFIDNNGVYGGRKVTPETLSFFKNLTSSQETSFRDLLITGKRNPVGIITLLNHDYGYATQTVRHEIGANRQDLDAIASSVGVALEQKS